MVREAPGKEHTPGKRASYKSLVLSFSAIGAAGDSQHLQSRGLKVTLHGKGFLLWGVESGLSGPTSPCGESGELSWWWWPQQGDLVGLGVL